MAGKYQWLNPNTAEVSEVSSDNIAVFLTGFQILVASSEEKLEKDIPDIWDSKKILSNTSSEIEFGGENLAVKSTHFWKLRFWNEKGIPSKYSGGSLRYQRVLLPVEPGKNKYTISLPTDNRNTGPAAIHLPDSFGVITPFRYCELEN